MRVVLVALVVVALVGAIGSSPAGRSVASGAETAAAATSPQVPPRTIVLFGHARSLARKGGRWELRLDPAAFLVGVTARRAASIRATRISVSELAQILRGKNPAGLELFAPRNGFWVAVTGDTIRSMDQQYTP